jgi:hypothetical protein
MRPATFWAALAIALLGACQTADERASDVIITPAWAESGPRAEDYLRVYPARAREAGIESHVRLTCTIRSDRKLDCKPSWEEIPDMGFGVAALAVSNLFVVKRTDDPTIQPGKQVILPIVFRLTD